MQQKMLCKTLRIAARDSKLSCIQMQEVVDQLLKKDPTLFLERIFVKTRGDLDKKTSLKNLDKTDFFTYEIDQLQLENLVDLAVHSRKDLPDPMHPELEVAAVTKGIDSRDSLVLRKGEDFFSLPPPRVATSSFRREKNVKKLREDVIFVDVRGSIDERLKQLEDHQFEAIVVAEAALLRLKYTDLNRLYLPGETAEGQGELAIVVRKKDQELKRFLQFLHKN